MKRLRLDGPPNVRLQEGGETYTPGQELEVSGGRAKELMAVKRLHLSVVKKKDEPAEGGTDEGGSNGTV